MNIASFNSSIWPWIKKVSTANFVSGVQSEVLNPIYLVAVFKMKEQVFLQLSTLELFMTFSMSCNCNM